MLGLLNDLQTRYGDHPSILATIGDYLAGPNHVLPTSGSARFTGGLSVLTYLKVQTWLSIDDEYDSCDDDEADETGEASRHCLQVREDSAMLARLEGLEAHARAAEIERGGGVSSDRLSGMQ